MQKQDQKNISKMSMDMNEDDMMKGMPDIGKDMQKMNKKGMQMKKGMSTKKTM